jgi:hypothetical protein
VRRLALAVDASTSAVAAVVRDAARGPERTPSVDGEALGRTRARRDGPEERQLRALARLCLRRPDLVGDELALKLQETLPAGAWKAIILQIIESAGDGLLVPGEDGSVDPFAVESRLDEEARLRLREIAVDDAPIDGERSADRVLGDLIGWFDLRRIAAREQELTRRMRDPDADLAALLEERHALLQERKAHLSDRRSVRAGGNAHASDGAD